MPHRLIEIRKLAAVDMAWLGARVIVVEYALGVVLPLALGCLSFRAGLAQSDPWNWQTVFGIWLITIAANYVPLFIYALSIARARTAQKEGQREFKNARRYGLQQAIILVPFVVVFVALLQERRRALKPQDCDPTPSPENRPLPDIRDSD
jgi:hypothetical protein